MVLTPENNYLSPVKLSDPPKFLELRSQLTIIDKHCPNIQEISFQVLLSPCNSNTFFLNTIYHLPKILI